MTPTARYGRCMSGELGAGPAAPSAAPPQVAFRVAQVRDTADVLAVLNEAAAWLTDRNITQWPARFDPGWVADEVARGETWLVVADGAVEGTVTLNWADPLWPDDGAAGYVHRLIVRRRGVGLGEAVLTWAENAVRARGRTAVRLDCLTHNVRLCRYYERHGFVLRGAAEVSAAGGRWPPGQPTREASLYEKALSGT